MKRSLLAGRRALFGNRQLDAGSIQKLVVCVGEDDLNLVRCGGKTDEDKGLAARVSPVPRRTVDSDMDVPLRGNTSRALGPNTGTIRRFSARYWMKTRPWANGSAKGGSTMILAGACSASGTTAAGPSTSPAV
jgi:hypothetical protein